MVHPTLYADILAKKMEEHNSTAYLINTGWIAGPYGVGYRIPLKDNRLAVDAILDGILIKHSLKLYRFLIFRSLNISMGWMIKC